VQLVAGAAKTVQTWRAMAKDGAELPPQQAVTMPSLLVIHPGETYDFEVMRSKSDSLMLRVISPETIQIRRAAFSRGGLREALPRQITEIPIILH
jgi:hypothetical protein